MSALEGADAMTQDEGRGAGGRTGVVVQIKVELRGVSKPPVWRRLRVRANTRLDRLREAIVAGFGWQGYHMHIFSSGPDEFGVPDPERRDPRAPKEELDCRPHPRAALRAGLTQQWWYPGATHPATTGPAGSS